MRNNAWNPSPSKTICCLIPLRHLCGDLLLDHLWKRENEKAHRQWTRRTQKQDGVILQTANMTICWTPATIPAIGSGTLLSRYQIVITKSCSCPCVSVEAIYSGRKRCKPCLEIAWEIHGWPFARSIFSVVQQLSYIFIAWNYRTRLAFAVPSQPWVIHEFPKLSPGRVYNAFCQSKWLPRWRKDMSNFLVMIKRDNDKGVPLPIAGIVAAVQHIVMFAVWRVKPTCFCFLGVYCLCAFSFFSFLQMFQ